MESFYLKNLNDFTELCKTELANDLKYNYSLAFKLLQSKYDYNKLQMIKKLTGISGTFYEYAVKYNEKMEQDY